MEKLALDPYIKNMLLGLGAIGALGAGAGALSGYLRRHLTGIEEEEELKRNPYFHTLPARDRSQLLRTALRREKKMRTRSTLGNMLLGGITAIPAGIAYGHVLNTGDSPFLELVRAVTTTKNSEKPPKT